MQARIQKWGNSLALRIPKPVAEDVQLSEGKRVEMSKIDGRLVVDPRPKPKYRLEALLKKVTRSNRHEVVEFGEPVGREVW